MYRPEIKVVDCTIRDGGLVNNSNFSLKTVRAVYRACCEAGIDYIEIGYKNSKEMFSVDEYGPWRFCVEEDIARVTDGIDKGTSKLAVMMDAHKSSPEDILDRSESDIDMIRVATYVKDVDKAIALANNANEKGYETAINVMAISREGGPFLDEALQQIGQETKVLAVYIVDSFGALYSEEVHYMVERFRMHLKDKEVGVHFHNNQQLAFANTIEGIIRNANYLDGTLYGLGRAAGNCPLELLLGFLKNPKYNIEPILRVIGDTIVPLQQEIFWGYHIPYMVTGIRNEHPLDAIKWMSGPDRDDYLAFYKQTVEED